MVSGSGMCWTVVVCSASFWTGWVVIPQRGDVPGLGMGSWWAEGNVRLRYRLGCYRSELCDRMRPFGCISVEVNLRCGGPDGLPLAWVVGC